MRCYAICGETKSTDTLAFHSIVIVGTQCKLFTKNVKANLLPSVAKHDIFVPDRGYFYFFSIRFTIFFGHFCSWFEFEYNNEVEYFQSFFLATPLS